MVSRAGALRPLTMFRGCRGRRDDVPAASFHLGVIPLYSPRPHPPFSLSEVEGKGIPYPLFHYRPRRHVAFDFGA